MEVVAQPFADPAQGVNGLDPQTLETVRISDSRELQELRGVDGTGGKDDLAPAGRWSAPPRCGEPAPRSPSGSRSCDGLGGRFAQNREVGDSFRGSEGMPP